METIAIEEPSLLSLGNHVLRAIGIRWLVAAMLPLPVLLISDPAAGGTIACLYLGLASAWLSTEIHRSGAQPGPLDAWLAKSLAVAIACMANVACFILFGLTVGVHTQFPFPGMAALSAVTALGLVPLLMRKTHEQFSAIILAGVLLLAAKLAGCVVARIVYGPGFDKEGRIAADWGTAKLMIGTFWILCVILSLGSFLADYLNRRRLDVCEAAAA